jgi:hypothetical protein
VSEKRQVFVLGAARTGTTLLQRLLNAYEDVLVWGEHEGFLEPVATGLFRALESRNIFDPSKRVTDAVRDSRPGERWQAWMNWGEPEDWKDAFRAFLERLFVPDGLPGKRWWGFKEIRYMANPADRTLDLLRELYPDALFAFIVRHPLNAIASVRHIPAGAAGLGELRRLCVTWDRRYRAYAAHRRRHPERCFWVVYEDLVRERGDVTRLLAAMDGRAIGEPQRAVLAARDGRWSSFQDDAVNDRWRELPASWVAVVASMLGPLCAELGYTLPARSAGRRLAERLLVGALRARDAVGGEREAPPATEPAPVAAPLASER